VTKLTRRSFLKQTSATAAIISLLPAMPALRPPLVRQNQWCPSCAPRLAAPW
jgi:hypothetical protein